VASLPTIAAGAVLAGRYEILEPLGKGGMGMVYKAHDRVLDDTVAIKVLRPDVAAEPEMARRFRSEIKLARKVRHRNVCGIHEYGEDGPLRFISMEFIEGVDLRHVLTRGGAPLPEEAFEIAVQLAQGLAAIHEAGIIHRDLKTPNIMRDAKGHVRLMDFGIAKQAGEAAGPAMTALGMIVGTPEYMSPEQARGEKVDFRSDLYALGIVVFEIFTGQVPFRAETPIATIFKHLQDAPPIEGAGLPAPLMPVLHKALAKSPADRYATAAEMVRALQQARREAFPGGRTAAAAPAPARPKPRAAGIEDLMAEAETLVTAGRLAEAQAVLRRAVDVDPHSAVAFRRLFEVAAAIAEKGVR
jgi:serine/threonine-protein kinase